MTNDDTILEVCARFSIHPDRLEAFEESARNCVGRVRENEPDTLRYDWFIDGPRHDAVAMDTYRGNEALMFHMQNLGAVFPAVLANSSASMSFLGEAGELVRKASQGLGARFYSFFAGIGEASAAGGYRREESTGGGGHLEILSEFTVAPESWTRFCELAHDHVDIVRKNDPGTLRYDWFLDERSHSCIALDTYRDAPGMFAHMANCRDIHHELLKLATLTTVFLGELPKDAAAAVAKYEPRILPFFQGLKSYPAGGFD